MLFSRAARNSLMHALARKLVTLRESTPKACLARGAQPLDARAGAKTCRGARKLVICATRGGARGSFAAPHMARRCGSGSSDRQGGAKASAHRVARKAVTRTMVRKLVICAMVQTPVTRAIARPGSGEEYHTVRVRNILTCCTTVGDAFGGCDLTPGCAAGRIMANPLHYGGHLCDRNCSQVVKDRNAVFSLSQEVSKRSVFLSALRIQRGPNPTGCHICRLRLKNIL